MKKYCRWFSQDSGHCMHRENASFSLASWCGHKVGYEWAMHDKKNVECELLKEC